MALLPSKTLKPSLPSSYFYGSSSFHSLSPQTPRLIFPSNSPLSAFSCKGVRINVPYLASSSPPLSGKDSLLPDSKLRGAGVKDIDVATLGNLCVDIVLNVPQLPPPSVEERKAFMERLSASPPDKKYWEAGGNCNMAIAASRLGLDCITIGHVGDEIYGRFLLDVLHEEGIGIVGMSGDNEIHRSSSSYETLLCWVLVDPLQRHGFCSRADFSKEPAFDWVKKLSGEVKTAIKRSKILFCNGYGFDDLSPDVLTLAIEYAVQVGTSIFFDPGPRGKSLSAGTPQEQRAFNQFLRMSDVLLLTSDEVETLTGFKDPIQAGQELLRKGVRTKCVIVKMGSKGSALITISNMACAPAFKVNVIDTVGCGDSYVAAIAYGFIHKLPIINTLAIANAVGAATAMGCGAGRNVATLERIKDLMKASDLNEDVEFWNDLVRKCTDVEEVIFLSKDVINGNAGKLSCVAFPNVVAELLAKLEYSQLEMKVLS